MQPVPGNSLVRTVTPRNVFFRNDPYLAHFVDGKIESDNAYDGAHTSYERELREGTIMARLTSSKAWVACKRSLTNGVGRAATALIVDDARAFKAAETVAIKGPVDIVRVTDDNSANSNGTAVYFHHDELGDNAFGHLESVNANNADSYFATQSGSRVEVEDDNSASSGGTQIYIDEDAAALDGRLMANFSDANDHYVLDSAGRAIRIAHNASASSVGVALYFDDDGATPANRLLFISPTDANGYFHTDDVVGLQLTVTRASGVTVSSINYGTNTITLGSGATWADGDQVYCDSLAGSEIARGILTERIDLYDANTRGYVDRYTGKICDQGNLIYDNILGDIAACLASSDNKLGAIRFYDDGVMV